MMTTFLAFILVLAILVIAHELGHFLAARKNGIKVDEFGFGFPPRIGGLRQENGHWKFYWGNREVAEDTHTLYSLNWIPLGGFVKIKGEDGSSVEDNDSFAGKKIWRRFIVLAAGVFMNIILAGVLLGIGYMIGLPSVPENLGYGAKVRDAKIEIVSVAEKSPASSVGLVSGDAILKVDDTTILKVEDLQNYFDSKKEMTVNLEIKRGEEILNKQVVPITLTETKRGGIGVFLMESSIVSYPWYVAIYKGFVAALVYTWEVLKAFAILIWGLVTRASGITDNLSGPVGIAVLTGRVAKLGLIYLLQFTAMLSVNLAVLNFLPFPALDGGRIFFLLIEKLRGKPVAKKVENAFHSAGFALLMIAVVLITVKDVGRFKDSFLNFWQKLF